MLINFKYETGNFNQVHDGDAASKRKRTIDVDALDALPLLTIILVVKELDLQSSFLASQLLLLLAEAIHQALLLSLVSHLEIIIGLLFGDSILHLAIAFEEVVNVVLLDVQLSKLQFLLELRM